MLYLLKEAPKRENANEEKALTQMHKDKEQLQKIQKALKINETQIRKEKVRLKHLQMAKRALDNEVSDIKEHEAECIAQLKKAKEAAEAAEIADCSAAMAVDQLDLEGNSIHKRKADLLHKSTPDTEGLSDNEAASLPRSVWPRLVLVSDDFNPHQGFVDDAEWTAWMRRKAQFKETNVLQQPDLTFAEWMTERDVCKDHKEDSSFRSKHFLFNIAFFCNSNRLWDEVTKQLQAAIAGQPKQVQTATVLLLRMAGSPREAEQPGRSGAAAIVKQLTNVFPASSVSDYVRYMPFTGRKTYRAVLNRKELAIIFEDVASDLASLETCASIQNLCDHVARSITGKHEGARGEKTRQHKEKAELSHRTDRL
jgi:hypothetical protein